MKDLHQYWDTETVGISPKFKKSREGTHQSLKKVEKVLFMEIRFDWLQQRYRVNLLSECRPQSIATGYDVFARFHQLRIRETKIFSMSTTVFSKLSCKMVLGPHSLVVYNLYQNIPSQHCYILYPQ